MGVLDQLIVGGSLLASFCTGWTFLDKGLVVDYEEQDLTIQVRVISSVASYTAMGPYVCCD